MANFTQAQCDASRITREKDKAGNWQIRVSNENGLYCEFPDTLSAANATVETSRKNADTHLKKHCEFKTAAEDLSTEQETI